MPDQAMGLVTSFLAFLAIVEPYRALSRAIVLTQSCDKVGRLTSTTGPSQWGALMWEYDKAGNRVNSTDAGCPVPYTYPTNDNGQQTLTAQPGCIPGVTLAVTWTHDNNGRVTQGDQTDNGVPSNIYYSIYDSAGRLTQDKKYS